MHVHPVPSCVSCISILHTCGACAVMYQQLYKLWITVFLQWQVSRLVVSEIVGRSNMADRVSCIEKWAAIADICRCMHNYNGVLQICAAFVNSSVYRLKKTWEKLSKQVFCSFSLMVCHDVCVCVCAHACVRACMRACVRVCTFVCFHIIPYLHCFGRTMLYMYIEYCV